MHFGYSTKQNGNRQFKMTVDVDKGDVWMEGGVRGGWNSERGCKKF
jgi:hypothetical protein